MSVEYPLHGYAPGGYYNDCRSCNAQFTGDKRARTCEPCALKERIAELEQDAARLKDVLHRDRSGLADALDTARNTANQWRWAIDGRGSYEWDDAEFHKEIGRLINAVESICTEALRSSGVLAHAECCAREAIDAAMLES